MAQQETMEKVSSRIWVLLAGIAVAIAIAVSALAMHNPEPVAPQASEPSLNKSKVSTVPVILMKKIQEKMIMKFRNQN